MESNKDTLSALDLEDITPILVLVPREKIKSHAELLGSQVDTLTFDATKLMAQADKKKSLQDALLRYLRADPLLDIVEEKQPTTKGPEDDKPNNEIVSTEPVNQLAATEEPELIKEETFPAVTDSGGDKEKPDRKRKNRGTLAERNAYIVKYTGQRDEWLFLTDYTESFIEQGWIDEEDNAKQATRSLLRLAEGVLALKTVYAVAPTRKVVTQRMYGLQMFLQPENELVYDSRLDKKLTELGFFRTQEEANRAKATNKIQDGQQTLL